MRNKQRELLIQLRSVLIAKENTLPYCIYTDATIEDLLDAQPKSMDALTNVKGFPKEGKRVKGFGEAIIEIFKNPNRVERFELQEGSNESDLSVGTHLKRSTAF